MELKKLKPEIKFKNWYMGTLNEITKNALSTGECAILIYE